MKVVLDSNVIVSAFATRGLCLSIFELSILTNTVVVSKHILSEVERILKNKINVPINTVNNIINYLEENCEILDYTKLPKRVCRDKDDDNIIALALSNNINLIITGDKDILILKKYKHISINSPKDYWKIISN
ncbi:putative toxin-antitoxin system toxin component, PIN family [candidate division WOR-3 bacterium]|nr:putative toxin-antitoxin system toxin component, PIN family [candidate division WOR-3 bacterium]